MYDAVCLLAVGRFSMLVCVSVDKTLRLPLTRTHFNATHITSSAAITTTSTVCVSTVRDIAAPNSRAHDALSSAQLRVRRRDASHFFTLFYCWRACNVTFMVFLIILCIILHSTEITSYRFS